MYNLSILKTLLFSSLFSLSSLPSLSSLCSLSSRSSSLAVLYSLCESPEPTPEAKAQSPVTIYRSNPWALGCSGPCSGLWASGSSRLWLLYSFFCLCSFCSPFSFSFLASLSSLSSLCSRYPLCSLCVHSFYSFFSLCSFCACVFLLLCGSVSLAQQPLCLSASVSLRLSLSLWASVSLCLCLPLSLCASACLPLPLPLANRYFSALPRHESASLRAALSRSLSLVSDICIRLYIYIYAYTTCR